MIGLQEMIMQCDGKRILLGAAWPAEWNCNFKLTPRIKLSSKVTWRMAR